MRMPIGLCIILGIAAAAALPSQPALKPNASKPKRDANSAPALPKPGIKTPGVQIPFASLQAEAEFAVAPPWLIFTDAPLAPNPSKDSLDRIDIKSNKLADPLSGLSQPCGGGVTAFSNLWVPACGDKTLVRLDTKTGKVTAKIASGTGSAQPAVAATADSVWVLSDDKTTLSRIDPGRNEIVAELRLAAGCNSLTFGETALWVTCPSANRVLRIDPQTVLVDKRIEVSPEPKALVIGEGSIWVLCEKDGKVERIDPKTNKVSKTIELGAPAAGGGIALGLGSLWVTMQGFPITRIDPQSEKVVQQFYGDGGGAIQVGLGSLWLSNRNAGTLWRLDPKRIAATLAE